MRAVAKGVRKTKSRFGARLEPPTHLQLQLYEGRSELHIIDQAETVDHFRAIRDDLDRLTRAVSMLEVADQLGLEGEPNPRAVPDAARRAPRPGRAQRSARGARASS